MNKQKIAIIGLILPVLPVFSYGCLVLISFANNKLDSVIAVDKLILLTIVLLIYASFLGTAVSIVALLKSPTKLASLALALNITVLLIILVFLRGAFFTEFKLII